MSTCVHVDVDMCVCNAYVHICMHNATYKSFCASNISIMPLTDSIFPQLLVWASFSHQNRWLGWVHACWWIVHELINQSFAQTRNYNQYNCVKLRTCNKWTSLEHCSASGLACQLVPLRGPEVKGCCLFRPYLHHATSYKLDFSIVWKDCSWIGLFNGI